MQKPSLILALALAFTPAVWAENVNINGTGVSIEANKTPINIAKNGDAIAQLPKDYRFAVPGKFTVAVAGLNQPPLTVSRMTTKRFWEAKLTWPVWWRTAWGWS